MAPERFEKNKRPDNKHKGIDVFKKMDIFSAGCVIAELFLEGEVRGAPC